MYANNQTQEWVEEQTAGDREKLFALARKKAKFIKKQFYDRRQLIEELVLVSCPASLSHTEKESGETRIQFWFHTYVTFYDTGTMNVIISDGAITV